jgi:glyoxylase-like metal-dependent hydrolase (beta-lactamase superfamily II)
MPVSSHFVSIASGYNVVAYVTEFARISASYALWHTYDPKIKAELFSTALAAGNGLAIIDPIALPPAHQADLESLGRVVRIVITNANHVRDAATFAHFYSAPIFAPPELLGELPFSHKLQDGFAIGPLRVVRIEGAADGEFALYHPDEGGTLIMGDALINFDPHGFTLLPRKYCANQKQMIRSLRNLLDLDFSRIFFAHGNPIMIRARERLEALLNS